MNRVARKIGALWMRGRYRRYVGGIRRDSVLHGIPARIVGDASGDPTEWFDHYEAFAYWAGKKIAARGAPVKVLDVGSKKLWCGLLSAVHDVTSLVLVDCGDSISEVKYLRHDVADRLPVADASFDFFSSMVSLPLIGLGRYGDRLDPNCLPNFVAELGRVMRADGELLISMCLGPNILNFNNGWFFDFPTLERLFGGWRIVDWLVDTGPSSAPRFTKDVSVSAIPRGAYRVIFLHLRRATR